MRIGLVADTHIPEAGSDLPPAAYAALAGCDRILHCGDLHTIEVLDRLGRVAPVVASRGNGDTLQPTGRRPGVPDDPRVVPSLVFDVGDVTIGLTHDLEQLELVPDDRAAALLEREFGRRVDVAVCGHTHVPMTWGLASGTIVVNPGSPTMPYGYPDRIGTVGFLDISAGGLEVRVVNIGTNEVELRLAGGTVSPCTRGPRPGPRP
jgi:uncharacterized protein